MNAFDALERLIECVKDCRMIEYYEVVIEFPNASYSTEYNSYSVAYGEFCKFTDLGENWPCLMSVEFHTIRRFEND